MVDTPENYYANLGVPTNTDNDTLKRAYRQLARRYHPDLAGPEGALERHALEANLTRGLSPPSWSVGAKIVLLPMLPHPMPLHWHLSTMVIRSGCVILTQEPIAKFSVAL